MPTPRRLRRTRRPPLTAAQVLAWADDFHSRAGRWPKTTDGRVPLDLNEKWLNVDQALRKGLRGLPGGDTLPRLLRRSGRHVPERWGRHRKAKPAAP